jgi:hypothetical protein
VARHVHLSFFGEEPSSFAPPAATIGHPAAMSLAPTRQSVSLDPPGTAFSRLIHAFSLDDWNQVQELSAPGIGPWRSTPQVYQVLVEMASKAAVPPGTTSDSAWAQPLVDYGFATEALTLLKEVSLFEQLRPRMRQVPFRTRIPRETGAGTGAAWVGEGLAKPATKTAYDRVTVEEYKVVSITTLTTELLKLGDPVAEKTVRASVIAGCAKFVDQQLLDPAITATTDRPASITNGAPAITSTGSTGTAILADLSAMLAAITTDGSGLVWVMKPKTAAHVAGNIGSAAGSDLPTRLFGLPVVLNANSPAQITLVDAPEILYADSAKIGMDGTRHAAVQSDDAPTTPLSLPMISAFQQDVFMTRCTRWLAWLRARDGSVVYMVVTY